LERRTTEINTT